MHVWPAKPRRRLGQRWPLLERDGGTDLEIAPEVGNQREVRAYLEHVQQGDRAIRRDHVRHEIGCVVGGTRQVGGNEHVGEWFGGRRGSASSSSSDNTRWRDWLRSSSLAPRGVFVAHGEPAGADALRRWLHEAFGWTARVPELGEVVELANA